MNSKFSCRPKRVLALGFSVAVMSFAVSASFAQQADDDLDSILNAPAMSAEHCFQSDGIRNDVFADANRLASRVANMYRDVRYRAYPSAPDASDIKAVCTVTVRNADSDSVLSVIKTASRVPTGAVQAVLVPPVQVARELVTMTSKVAREALPKLRDTKNKSVEVMVQVRRNDSSQFTVVVSADNQNGGVYTGVSFVSKDDALPNVTDGGY